MSIKSALLGAVRTAFGIGISDLSAEAREREEEARQRACGNYTERQFQKDMDAYVRKAERKGFFFQK